MKVKRSFTLIEMLIVIVIIGILASALIPRITAAQGKARDTKRKTDLFEIANALEVFNSDKGAYPYSPNEYLYSLNAQPWLTSPTNGGLSGYMTSIPVDPINNATGTWTNGNYSYLYIAPLTNKYTLDAQLESHSDPDRCEIKHYYVYTLGGAFLWCGPYSPYIYGAGAYATQ